MLAIEDVSVAFGGVRALSEVSFEVPQGQICGVIGPNGAGKTTLFDVVCGLRRPLTGRVSVEGTDVTSLSPVKRARGGLRRTFQRTQVFGRLTVAGNVLAALDWRGGGGGLPADLVGWPSRRRLERAREERAAEVLELCGLSDLRDAYAAALPVGQRRLVELARAIADRPRLLLLDEITSQLDAASELALRDAVESIARTTTVMVIAHRLSTVMNAAQIVVVESGRVRATGTHAELVDTDRLYRELASGQFLSPALR